MKLIPFALLLVLCSCGPSNDLENKAPKNVKAGNLQFFEVYSLSEIFESWKAACDWVDKHDSLALNAKISNTDSRGLSRLLRPVGGYVIGYVSEEDMPEVDSMLATPEVKNNFFKDLKFMWSFGAEEIHGSIKKYALYAVKMPAGNKARIDGRHVLSASAARSQFGNSPIIRIEMSENGAHDWEVMTRENIGRAIAITIDNHVLSCPIVNGAIAGGSTEISGNFSVKEAEELAARINAGK